MIKVILDETYANMSDAQLGIHAKSSLTKEEVMHRVDDDHPANIEVRKTTEFAKPCRKFCGEFITSSSS